MQIPWTTVDVVVASLLCVRALQEYVLAYHLAPRRLRSLERLTARDPAADSLRRYWQERRRQVIEGNLVARNALVALAFIAILVWRLYRG